MPHLSVPIVPQDEARESLSVAAGISIIEQSYRDYGRHRGVLSAPPAMLVPSLPGAAQLRVKGALAPSVGVAGFRMIVNRGSATGRQTLTACWVMDALTGELIGIVDETRLHRFRTALTGVVAARWLAPPKVERVAIIGAGRIADELPAILAGRFGSPQFVVAARSLASAEAFVARHRTTLQMEPAATADMALKAADIVLAISAADVPVVAARHLRPGMTIVSLGGGPEIAADMLDKIDRLIVDDLDYASTIGSVKGWLDQGVGLERIRDRMSADIGEVALGTGGRQDASETVLAVIQGMASCDVALAGAVLKRGAGKCGDGGNVPV